MHLQEISLETVSFKLHWNDHQTFILNGLNGEGYGIQDLFAS